MAPLETQKRAPYTDAEESSVRAIVDATSPHSESPIEESQALDHPEVQRILGVYDSLGETRKKYADQRSVYRAINQLLDLADETDDLVEKRRAATAVLRFFIYDQRYNLKGDPAASGHAPRVAAPRVARPIKRTTDDPLRETDPLALSAPGATEPGVGSLAPRTQARPKQTAAPPRRSRKDKKRQKRPAKTKQKSTAHQSDPAQQRAGPDPSPDAPSSAPPDAVPSETPSTIPFPSSDAPTPIKSLTARAGTAPHNTS